MEVVTTLWSFLVVPENLAIILATGALLGFLWKVYVHFYPRDAMKKSCDSPSSSIGGEGGSAYVGGSGVAIGGKGGGRFGSIGGHGGSGGSAKVEGDGRAVGGDGGEVGNVEMRPAIGAASVAERSNEFLPNDVWDSLPKDKYGVLLSGRGGDSHTVTIEVDGVFYELNTLLRLIRIGNDTILNKVDQLEPRNPSEWWLFAMRQFPDETRKAMEHMRIVDQATKMNSQLPNPYA